MSAMSKMDGRRPGNLHNRRIIIERDFQRGRSYRFRYWWDNPYGTMSHDGYAATFLGAVIRAVSAKIRAEFRHWQDHRPIRQWTI